MFWSEAHPFIVLLVRKLLLYLCDEVSQGKNPSARFFHLFTPKMALRGGLGLIVRAILLDRLALPRVQGHFFTQFAYLKM